MGEEDARSNTVKILGFEIEKKTSFTSLAAFLLSIWGVTQGIYYYWKGSELDLVLPDRVIVFLDACRAGAYGETVNFAVPITVVNSAPKDYSSVLGDIRLSFVLGKKSYSFDSESYVNVGTSTAEKSGVVECDAPQEKKAGTFIEELGAVPAEVISGGTSYVRYVSFVPSLPVCDKGGDDCYRKNYLKASDGIPMMAELAQSTGRLSFDISIEYDDDESNKETCTIVVNNDVVEGLKKNRSIDGFCLKQG